MAITFSGISFSGGLSISGTAPETDPDFSNVSLLLDGNGTNGSTSFTDLSDNSLSVTTNGNVEVSTSVKKFGTGSIKFDGATNSYLEVASSSVFDLGTSDWTIEGWIYPQTDSDDRGGIFGVVR